MSSDFIDLTTNLDDEDEAAWEEAVLTETLGEALNPDGSIDYTKLKMTDVVIKEL